MYKDRIDSEPTRRMVLVAAVVLLVAVVFAVAVAPAGAAFGIKGFDGQVTADAGGAAYTQAGGHPYAITTEVEFNNHPDPLFGERFAPFNLVPDAPARDVLVDLPAGLVGNPGSVAKCSSGQLVLTQAELGGSVTQWCPIASQVGLATLDDAGAPLTFPLFAMQPPPNVPARFGFNAAGVLISLDASLRSDGDYGLSVSSRGISEALSVAGIETTIWGVPADSVHDQDRCYAIHGSSVSPLCTGTPGDPREGPNPSGRVPVPFMTQPTRCTAPGVGLETKLRVDSWNNPGVFDEASFVSHLPPNFPLPPAERGAPVGITGCDAVPFEPNVDVAPTSSAPDSPSGLGVDLSIPTEGLENPSGIAQSDLKKIVVALPEGMSVNPSSADGLGACTSAEIKLGSLDDPSCPESSKIGTLEVQTPLLEAPLEGSVYLASQGDNPFGSLLAGYLVAKGPGLILKFPGKFDTDPVTGRLTATFDDLAQVPFGKTTLTLKGGSRAPLATPAACGASQVSTTLEGWNGKSVTQITPYNVDCVPGLGGFAPSFDAGTTNPQAGAYSPFTLTFSRQDGEQNLQGVGVSFPKGLIGKLAGIPLCPEAQANAGTCSDASRIGTVTAAAGAGPHPYYVQGKVFLTGGYNGGPFGESVVIPAKAGPFDLGTVVVRGSIRIDPDTAQASVVSDPFPQILQGIPLRTRTVNVTLDRPGFMFNPTDCEPLTIAGTVSSAQGATANVSSHFQAANCAALPFNPSFKVNTKAKTSKAGGAYLDVKLTPGAGQANLGKVAVSLPKQLPSRLTTIQQACTKAVFDQNPASCPAGSNIGIATATTPVLANPVTGPVYLVSHGGASFPDLVMILQGEGVTTRITGSINIKNGVTSSAFDSVPDIPISTFELNLPQGPHSALGTNLPAKVKGNLCGQNLVMPTTLTGQNNAQVKQNTKITVTGCPKAKKVKKHTRRAHGKATTKKPGKGNGK